MNFPNVVHMGDEQVYADDARPEMPIGQRVELPNGRTYRYALAGATALISGLLQQSPVEGGSDNNDTLAVATAVAVGDASIKITNGATPWAEDELHDGFLILEGGAELGAHYWTIDKNTAEPVGSAAMTITLKPGVSFDTVLTVATSKMMIGPNPWNKVVVFPLTPTGVATGVATKIVTAGYYGYLQTHGLGSGKVNSGATGTPTLGEPASTSDTAVGCLAGRDVDVDHQEVGRFVSVIATDLDHVIVFYTID